MNRPWIVVVLGIAVLALVACGLSRARAGTSGQERYRDRVSIATPTAGAGARQPNSSPTARCERPLAGLVVDTMLSEPLVGPDPKVAGDRDLGPGADNEKLGDPRHPDPQPAEDAIDPVSGERYAPVVDHPFVRTTDAGGDASTFGLDVDSASYANCRRFITEHHRLPPAGAVRIEELINTLAYDYPEPDAGAEIPFHATTTVAACPWSPAHRLVRVAVRARTVAPAQRPPLNLVFLVDTSGSMQDANKLPLVQRSLLLLAEHLEDRDRLAIVTYAGSVGTLLPATPGSEQRRMRDAIASLRANGSTNGAGGITAAYAEAARGAAPGVISRVMLCTDGDFNVGVTGLDELKRLVETQRSGGTCLNVYGFGMGNLKDQTLEMIADHGNGLYGYIDSDEEAKRLFDREVMGQLVTVAKDAKVQVFFNPKAVGAWRLLGYENRVLRREDFNDDRVDAGDIGAGHTVTALYEIVPTGTDVPQAAPATDGNPFLATAEPAAAVDAGTMFRVRLSWKDPDSASSKLLEHDVHQTLSEMDADFKTAAAAAGFGMLLRRSPWKGACTWDLVGRLIGEGIGPDVHGQRREFQALVARARALAAAR